MLLPRFWSRIQFWVFAAPLALLVFLPPVCLVSAYLIQRALGITSDAGWYFFLVFLFWGETPSLLFPRVFPDVGEMGYSIHGILVVSAVLAFYVAISLSISFAWRYILQRGKRRRHI